MTTVEQEEIILTPSEDLAIDVLLARYRLGENLWTFESRHKKTLDKLAARGYVSVIHGIVEKTVRASLTELGKRKFFDGSRYVSPLEEEVEELKRKKHTEAFAPRRPRAW